MSGSAAHSVTEEIRTALEGEAPASHIGASPHPPAPSPNSGRGGVEVDTPLSLEGRGVEGKDRTSAAYLFGAASIFQQALAVFAKDLRAELRNRAALNAILLFAITSLVVISYAIAGGGLQSAVLKAALLWVVLFFAAFSGLAHVFIHEEETSTVITLRLTAAPGAVYAGKLLFNLSLLLVITLVVVPLFAVILDMPFNRPLAFAAVVLSGGLGLGAAATIVAAIIAKARGKGALYGALGFPVLLPQLMMAVHATRLVMMDAPTELMLRDIAGLLAFAVMLITASALLFPFVWED